MIKTECLSLPKWYIHVDVVEINTYEQLREMDGDSNHLKMDAIQVICEALSVSADDIVDITVLKKGMTNRSFCLPAMVRNIL